MSTKPEINRVDDKTELQLRIVRELRSLERDDRGNVLAKEHTVIALHEATRLILFLGAISGNRFIQDRRAYTVVHRTCVRYINTYKGGITTEAEAKYGWCPQIGLATREYHAHWSQQPRRRSS